MQSRPLDDSHACLDERVIDPHEIGLRVLLVEDDIDAVARMALLLQVDGHQVRVAGTGRAACLVAQDEEPDVVLLGFSGWEVVKQIQE